MLSPEDQPPFPEQPSVLLPEARAYLDENPEASPQHMLVMPHIPPLVGGPKSNKFIYREPWDDPDTLPDPSQTLDTGNGIDRKGLGGFASSFDDMERQADDNYDIMLQETQTLLDEAATEGSTITTLLVPDDVVVVSSDYYARLERLAQDTGLEVVIKVFDIENSAICYRGWETFTPPRTEDVQGYWGKLQEKMVRQRKPTEELTPAIDDSVATQATGYLAEALGGGYRLDGYGEDGESQTQWLRNTMQIMAGGTDGAIESGMPDEATREKIISFLREAANFGTEKEYWGGRLPEEDPRLILAKLGDPYALKQLLNEIEANTKITMNHAASRVPLGIALQKDPEALALLIANTGLAAANPQAPASEQLMGYIGALHCTDSPAVTELFIKCLAFDENVSDTYATHVLRTVFRILPEHTLQLQQQQDNPAKHAALTNLQECMLRMLVQVLNEDSAFAKVPHCRPADLIAEALFISAKPEFEPVLRAYVLSVYREGKCRIKDQHFVPVYLLYRELYGDMPEISDAFTHPENPTATAAHTGSAALYESAAGGVITQLRAGISHLQNVQAHTQEAATAVGNAMQMVLRALAGSTDAGGLELYMQLQQIMAAQTGETQKVTASIEALQLYILTIR